VAYDAATAAMKATPIPPEIVAKIEAAPKEVIEG
jgi:hypothetical protein